jgi:cellulose 1,4-beta-cellobiosidase
LTSCDVDESISARLSNVSGAALGTDLVWIAIQDDDDVTPPTVPSNLIATRASGSQVNLTWSASTENHFPYVSGVAGYRIYRAGVQIGTASSTSYSDTSASSNLAYTVAAYDNAGNVSAQSNASTPTDNVAPSTPTGLAAAAASSSQINLSWNASSDTGGSGLAGYRLVRANDNAAFSTSSTSFSNTGLTGSTTYTYYVYARDNQGNESAAAGPVSATTQAPPIYTDNGTVTSGVYVDINFFFSYGYLPSFGAGSMSPSVLTGGKTVGTFADIEGGGAQLWVSGFTSDPGQSWLASATAHGATRTGASATYTYWSSTGTASWSWPNFFGFSLNATTATSIVHQP